MLSTWRADVVGDVAGLTAPLGRRGRSVFCCFGIPSAAVLVAVGGAFALGDGATAGSMFIAPPPSKGDEAPSLVRIALSAGGWRRVLADDRLGHPNSGGAAEVAVTFPGHGAAGFGEALVALSLNRHDLLSGARSSSAGTTSARSLLTGGWIWWETSGGASDPVSFTLTASGTPTLPWTWTQPPSSPTLDDPPLVFASGGGGGGGGGDSGDATLVGNPSLPGSSPFSIPDSLDHWELEEDGKSEPPVVVPIPTPAVLGVAGLFGAWVVRRKVMRGGPRSRQ